MRLAPFARANAWAIAFDRDQHAGFIHGALKILVIANLQVREGRVQRRADGEGQLGGFFDKGHIK
ncbi:hypothetical protein K6106_02275 [Pseudomonas fluorescens]|nr:hypothetical protein K6106_02275 [Pseudomonas fluorescens]